MWAGREREKTVGIFREALGPAHSARASSASCISVCHNPTVSKDAELEEGGTKSDYYAITLTGPYSVALSTHKEDILCSMSVLYVHGAELLSNCP